MGVKKPTKSEKRLQVRFNPGQEPRVLTSISEACGGNNCPACPGIFSDDHHPGQRIFCVHDCHLKRNQDVSE